MLKAERGMSMKKRILSVILAVVIMMSLSGCGKNNSTDNIDNGNSIAAVSQSTKVTDKAYEIFNTTGTYTGDWENGMPNGHGTYTANSAIYVYSGNWINGFPNGDGEEYYNNEYYNGEFFNGMRQGQGYCEIYYEEESHAYKGDFMNNEFNGSGILHTYFNDGSILVREGEFANGSFFGRLNYSFYQDDVLVETGIFENGEFISDEEINKNNALYDGLGIFADAIGVGELYDEFAPYVYDRDNY